MNYQEINREERYFCFLLGHALLSSTMFRDEFCKLVGIEAADLKVYPEAAWLRDYWSSLGYEADKNNKRKKLGKEDRGHGRRACLKKIFCDIDLKNIFEEIWDGAPFTDMSHFKSFEEDFFWSKEANGEGELVYPGRWPLALLDKYDDHREQLMWLKWSFNAKPDLMLISGPQSVLLEVKVESNEGDYSYKGKKTVRAKQLRIQRLVGRLIKELNSNNPQLPQHCFLSKCMSTAALDSSVKSVLWENVIEISQKVADEARQECDKLDDFTLKGFSDSRIINP